MAQDNRATLERNLDAMMRGDWDTVGEAIADDAIVDFDGLSVARTFDRRTPPWFSGVPSFLSRRR
jgi:hypothetical protein